MLLRVLLAVCISLSASAHQTDTYALSGVVVNSVTGDPIPHAVVSLAGRTSASIMASPDGRFEFPNLPAGRYELVARKPGYFTEHEVTNNPPYGTPAIVSAEASPTVVKLVPEALIVGRVTDTSGEPVPAIDIRIFDSGIVDGRKTMRAVANTRTNSNGDYRVAELRPGTYIVAASAGIRPATTLTNISGTSGSQLVPAAFPPVVFYPNARDAGGAAPITLSPGQRTEVSFTLRAERAFRFEGLVTGVRTGQIVWLTLENAVDLPGAWTIPGIQVDFRTGAFHGQCVAGEYRLTAHANDSDGMEMSSSVRLNVSSDMMGVHVDLMRHANLNVELHSSFAIAAGDLPASVGLQMVRSDGLVVDAQNTQDGMQFHNLPPGTYRLVTHNHAKRYVSEATWGTTDVLHDSFGVPPGGSDVPIEVGIREDIGMIAGTVNDVPLGTKFSILLIPADGTPTIDIRTIEKGPSFELPNVPPGEYFVLAIDSLDSLAYRDTQVLSNLQTKAVRISVAAGTKAQVMLDLIRRGEQ